MRTVENCERMRCSELRRDSAIDCEDCILKDTCETRKNERPMIDNPKNLIEFVKANFPHDDYIFEEYGKWTVTDEWLVGTLAGRGFVGKTAEEAAQHLIEYLNTHIGHDSIVGGIVTKSGWPDANAVKAYTKTKVAGEGADNERES